MRLKRGSTYIDGEGRTWVIDHFSPHGAVGLSHHSVNWRAKPFVSQRLFDEHGRTIAGLGRDAMLLEEVA